MMEELARYYEHELLVADKHIDGMGHVNNLFYLEWALEAAVEHSRRNGWTFARYQEIGAAWVVRGHSITYHRPAYVGDKVVVRTWISNRSKVTSRRTYHIERVTEEKRERLAEAFTDWAFVDLARMVPCRIPPEVIASFPVVEEET